MTGWGGRVEKKKGVIVANPCRSVGHSLCLCLSVSVCLCQSVCLSLFICSVQLSVFALVFSVQLMLFLGGEDAERMCSPILVHA